MVVVQHVLQVCCFISLMLPVHNYVLFAANVDDFRNLAKRFIPDELAEKLTDLVSHTGNKSLKDRAITNAGIPVRKNVRERTTTINDYQALTDTPMYQIRGSKRQREPSNQKSQIKFEYDEIQYTSITTIPNPNVRKRPDRLEPKPSEKRFKVKPPIQVHDDFEVEHESQKIKPIINNVQRGRIPIPNMKKGPSEDSSVKKGPNLNQQETLQGDYAEDNVYKKSNIESRFDNVEQKNSYLKKMPHNQNGDRPKSHSKYPHDSRYETEEIFSEEKKNKNELTTVKDARQPQLDYDYDDITTKFVTLEEKRYGPIRGRISNTNPKDLSVMKLKETFSRAATPKNPEMRESVVKQRKRTATTRERDYDMRQKKVTPMRQVEFGIRETNSQGRENEMRMQNGRDIRDRKRQKPQAFEDDQRYEKNNPPKPTNNDYDIRYERPRPSKPTNNDYDNRYERPRPSKPTNNDYDLPYKRPQPAKPTKNQNNLRYQGPHPSKPTKKDYDLPYEKPYPSKPTKNDYFLPYEKPYPSKPIKNDYDLPYENRPSKPTKNDHDLYYEKPNPSKQTNNDYDLYNEKSHMSQPTTSNYDKIPNKQNPPVKDDDYFDDYHLKPIVKVPRVPGANIQHKPAQKGDIYASDEIPIVPSIKNKKIISNFGAKRPVANEKRPVTNEKRPVANEEDQDMYAEVVHEPVKARTESLNFDVDYDNNTGVIRTTRHIMKGTGIPTRQTYKMSSPDYYKRLPRIVEKYDFSEPIPEADRVREVPNDRLVLEQGRVNMKVKQNKANVKEVYEERPEFEPEPVKGYDDNNENMDNNNQPGAIMEEFSLIT